MKTDTFYIGMHYYLQHYKFSIRLLNISFVYFSVYGWSMSFNILKQCAFSKNEAIF